MSLGVLATDGLPRLGTAGDQDVEAARDGGVQEGSHLRGQRAEGHEVLEVTRTHHELAHVDRPVRTSDVGDRDVRPRAVRQRRVDECRCAVTTQPRAVLAAASADCIGHLDVVDQGTVNSLGVARR